MSATEGPATGEATAWIRSPKDAVREAVTLGESSLIRAEVSPAPRTAKGRATLIQLKEAGREVFRRDGYVHARVSDIAAAAGLSNGAFYRYFTDKEHLMLVILDDFLRQYRDYIRVPFNPDRPLASIQESNARYFEFYREHVDLMLLLIQASQVVEEVRALWLSSAAEVYARMARLLKRCEDLGLLREGVRIELVAPLLGGMIEQYGYMTYVHNAHEVDDPAVIAEEVTAMWVSGILKNVSR